jgi:YYY domain-containing protein
VIAEAVTPLYRWGSRISVYTGLPTINGWDWHQKQQRAAVGGQVVEWRLEDVATLYNTTDVAQAVDILARYQVSLVYVGELEQAYYEPLGLAKFEAMVGYQLDVIYRDGPVTIYRVREEIGDSAATAADDVSDGAASGEGLIAAVRDWLSLHWVGPAVAAEGPDEASAGGTAMLSTPLDEAPVIRDVGWNAAATASPLLAAIVWWLAMQLVGLAVWPAAARLLPQFSDGGYALAKIMGLLALGYVVWLGASLRLWMNTTATAWVAVAALAAACWWLARRKPVAVLWREARGHIVWAELLFSGGDLLFIILRLLNPDLWQPWFGGEKTMEIAILNAVERSAYMPPYDPYFAGGYLNYYYYGYFLVGLLSKLTGIAPQVAFNLAVPTFYGLTLSAACALGCQLAARFILPEEEGPAGEAGGRHSFPSRHRIAAGLTTVVALAVMGNLTTFAQLAGGLYTVGRAASGGSAGPLRALGLGLADIVAGRAALPAFDYWYAPTRAIAGTINEFPFFSFLFADLHPHMMAVPFALLAIALCLGVALDTRGARMPLGAWLLLPLWLGALGPLNTWDLPTYLALLALVLAFRGYRAHGVLGLVRGLSYGVIIAVAAVALYAPFYAHLAPQYGSLRLVPAESRSALGEFLSVWGLFLFILVSMVCYWARRMWNDQRGRPLTRAVVLRWALCAALLAAAFGLALAGQWTLALLVPLWGVVGLILLAGERRRRLFMRRAMIWLALTLLIGVEFIYVSDWLDGDIWFRMNTVFKYDLQAWVLLAVALGSLMPDLWRHLGDSLWGQSLWRSACAVLLAIALLYPALAVPVRVAERFPGEQPARNTLDGTAYMAVGVYTWPDETNPIALGPEREAIAWLWANVQGTPVMAVAPLGYYREGGTLATAYTGFPALVGLHSSEQRPWEEVALRQSDADALYTAPRIPPNCVRFWPAMACAISTWGRWSVAPMPQRAWPSSKRWPTRGTGPRLRE